jgi:hypothetical protein
MPSPVVNLDTPGVESTPAMNWHFPLEDNVQDGESTSGEVDNQSYQQNMNYTFALSHCATLCKTAGHDKRTLASVVSLIDEATMCLRSGLHINPTYSDVALVGIPQNQENLQNIENIPLPAVAGYHRRPTSQTRFKSIAEISRSRKRKADTQRGKLVSDSESLMMEPLANTGKSTRTCSLCYQKGHTVRHCPSLEPYAGVPLAAKDSAGISLLSISVFQANLYATDLLDDSYEPVYVSLPSGVQALIIHQRLLLNDSFCFNCTILHQRGMEHERYTKQVFQVGCIAKHVTKNNQNIVKSELKLLASAGDVPRNVDQFLVAPYLSQLSTINDGSALHNIG